MISPVTSKQNLCKISFPSQHRKQTLLSVHLTIPRLQQLFDLRTVEPHLHLLRDPDLASSDVWSRLSCCHATTPLIVLFCLYSRIGAKNLSRSPISARPKPHYFLVRSTTQQANRFAGYTLSTGDRQPFRTRGICNRSKSSQEPSFEPPCRLLGSCRQPGKPRYVK